ncbi:RNI-like protein [Piedraia hortae CBS 480.64]|uniref:RNI-like protein n=1 Tax=Piedraia hortae CBS 480.64 TaxID=1314780 RepID=A0A6A7C1Y9_9PEZI|nr:RNI-like protein [Piedraia hortae CBS 480.64]
MRRQQLRASQAAVRSTTADPSTLVYSFDASLNPSRPVKSSPLGSSTIAGLPLELLDRLKAFPLFESAPESFLVDIGMCLHPHIYQTSQDIIREGEDAKAMYWLVRGSVRVTSRDGESIYTELRPGAFFGEIGILMDMPRTASIAASTRSLVVRLNKEDLQKSLPIYPDVERAIREEALERLAILERKKTEKGTSDDPGGPRKRSRDWMANNVDTGDEELSVDGATLANKKRKSPSPSVAEAVVDPPLPVRSLLKELPLFSGLPGEILHFIGVNAQPLSFPPFVEIIKQGTSGRDVYFIIQGEVEVFAVVSDNADCMPKVRARLKAGQYFGEVTNLSLAPTRTATVRSVNSVDCLLISGHVLDELWRRCGSHLRRQVESEAKRRLNEASVDFKLCPDEFDVPMSPIDPDPYFLPDLKAKSRRSSLAPPVETPSLSSSSRPTSRGSTSATLTAAHAPQRPSLARGLSASVKGKLPDHILTIVFQHLELLDLMRLRLVCMHWWHLINTEPNILHNLDLSKHNRRVTDEALRDNICPFVGNRPRVINLNNCFHVTDDGFKALAETCGEQARVWKMKSVWDVSAMAILTLIEQAKELEELDLSNCRKVGDNLLARVVGWAVPPKPRGSATSVTQTPTKGKRKGGSRRGTASSQKQPATTATLTAIGFPKLRKLTLSYCKHIQDRSMLHLALHASSRLESLDLTRCTSISDAAFNSWGSYSFPSLRRLILADCTYLSDQAIVGIVGGCRFLKEIDLSFCCALSDTGTQVLALGLPSLESLNMAFCGSAISDCSLRRIGMHLSNLRSLSVRGCVRVTRLGVEAVVEGCEDLKHFDVSQCKNLRPWIESHGVESIKSGLGRNVSFEIVAGGVVE